MLVSCHFDVAFYSPVCSPAKITIIRVVFSLLNTTMQKCSTHKITVITKITKKNDKKQTKITVENSEDLEALIKQPESVK